VSLSFKQYLVEETREVYFTFGRMNPPTIGHGKLMQALATKAGRNPYKIYLSQSSDPKKNPLTYDQKIKHVRKMFPKYGRNVILNKKIRNVFEIAVSLYDQGFNRVTMVVGSDRIAEFNALLNKYNGEKARHGFYNFEKISVVSAGDRDPDAEGVEGMSASKQRANANANDFTTFAQGVPANVSNKDAKKLFNDIRVGMGLKETTQFRNHVELKSVSQTREKYVNGDLFNEGDRVIITSSQKEGYVHRLGTNYVIVALDEGRISRQWLESVQKTDGWYKEQPEWGTPESTKSAKKTTPGEKNEDQVANTKLKIDKEKEQDKIKFDRMLDKARLARAVRKNRGLPPKPTRKEDKMNSVKFDVKDTVTFRKRNKE
jgi:nicotinamide mononucleotide adenylyltransferase